MLAVTKFRGTYFMCEFDTEQKKRQKERTTPRQEEMCAWGFKFEQYVVAGTFKYIFILHIYCELSEFYQNYRKINGLFNFVCRI